MMDLRSSNAMGAVEAQLYCVCEQEDFMSFEIAFVL